MVAALAALSGAPARAQTPAATPAPAYVRRGDTVETRYRAYRDRLERFYKDLATHVAAEAPDLLPQVKKAAPNPVPHGYQILPKLVPDAPPPSLAPRARDAVYSWPWTEEMIQRDARTLDALEADLHSLASRPAGEHRAIYEKILHQYGSLASWQRTIDAHIQYNRLWQHAIDIDRPGYDRGTVLHDAVLQRQSVSDALSAAGDDAFRQALAGVKRIDTTKPRAAVEAELRSRQLELTRQVQTATDNINPPPFLRVEHRRAHLWILHVPLVTDIADPAFVHAFKHGVEQVWQLRDGDDEFRVRVSITVLPSALLYGREPAPRRGDPIDVNRHCARFPAGAGVLTTGALTTHVTLGRCIALGPHDLTPHVLAHEFGHILGFGDVYFRGYHDLGADGYEVMEVIADPQDIMGNPGTGPVGRHHFERLRARAAPARNGAS